MTELQSYGVSRPPPVPVSGQAPEQVGGPAESEPAGAETWAWDAQGEQVFGTICSVCHQPTGEGVPGVFPPLRGDPVVNDPDPTLHIQTVLNGLQGKVIGGVTYVTPMPAFGPHLSDEQIAAAINHERTSWGNAAPTILPEDVAALR
jgi:mono/diheme cytochrome c family protein